MRLIVSVVLFSLVLGGAHADVDLARQLKAEKERALREKIKADPRGAHRQRRAREAREYEMRAGIMYRPDYEKRRKDLALRKNEGFYPKGRKPVNNAERKLKQNEDVAFWERFLDGHDISLPTAVPTKAPTPEGTAAPTPAPVAGTPAPVAGTPAPVAGTPAPVAGTPAPVAGTPAPVAGTPAPVAGTPAPVAQTPAPVAQTPAPVAQTPAPVAQTPAPVAQTPAPVPVACPLLPIIEPVALPGTDLNDITTYQGMAFDWLCNSNFEGLSDARIIQRYAMACIYYATFAVMTVFTDAAFGEGNILPWQVSTNWVTDADECTWARIACNDAGFVMTIDLFRNVVTGEMPPEVILMASSLKILDFGENLIFAEPTIATALGQLTELTDLRYDQSNFISETGIPVEIGNLKKLEVYVASQTLYRGALSEATFPSDMTALSFIEIEFNAYNSTIPLAIGDLPALERFYIRDSFVGGDLEFMRGMPSIVECWVDINPGLTGNLPTFLGDLKTLASFSVTECGFDGPLPTEIGLLSNSMTRMFYYDNAFTGGIPVEWQSLTKMDILQVQNNMLTVPIPFEICSLTFASLTNLIADCVICPTTGTCCDECV